MEKPLKFSCSNLNYFHSLQLVKFSLHAPWANKQILFSKFLIFIKLNGKMVITIMLFDILSREEGNDFVTTLQSLNS